MRKETPILLCTDMALAMLDDRKSQTRRLNGFDEVNRNPDAWQLVEMRQVEGAMYAMMFNRAAGRDLAVKCPYGAPGDLLWFKEMHRFLYRDAAGLHVEYAVDEESLSWGTEYEPKEYNPWRNGKKIWRPSIFLPKDCARLWGRNKAIGAERVQEISEEDAKAEGVEWSRQFGLFRSYHSQDRGGFVFESAVRSYISLWDSLNGKKAPWDSNPWVWAIAFKRVERKE